MNCIRFEASMVTDYHEVISGSLQNIENSFHTGTEDFITLQRTLNFTNIQRMHMF